MLGGLGAKGPGQRARGDGATMRYWNAGVRVDEVRSGYGRVRLGVELEVVLLARARGAVRMGAERVVVADCEAESGREKFGATCLSLPLN